MGQRAPLITLTSLYFISFFLSFNRLKIYTLPSSGSQLLGDRLVVDARLVGAGHGGNDRRMAVGGARERERDGRDTNVTC